jgi:hypothetical protein
VKVAVVPADETVPPTTPLGSLKLNVALDSEVPFTALAKVTFTVVTGLTVAAALAGLVETTPIAAGFCGMTGTSVAPELSLAGVSPHPARTLMRSRCARPSRTARVTDRWVNERMA